MAATIQILSYHGGSSGNPGSPGSSTNVELVAFGSAFKYKRADNDTNDNLNPIPKPASGNNYSWRKAFKMNVSVTPDGDITNVRWFGDGGNFGTGVKVYGLKNNTYTVASGSDESAQISGSPSDLWATYTSGSPLTITSGTLLSNPSTGVGTHGSGADQQNYLESQMQVADTASRGTKGPRTFTYRWDET